ncbi:helix-turn-helix domain-containing protein [Streptomyces sp. NPDC017943]|uniref:helix-turn-helix domain-containing protein n=1 Tax=Streptomyces sp. NPDC017943 TaxID=3365019 RepID=UPI0037A1B8BA
MSRRPDIPLPPPKERRRLRESASLTRAQLASQVGVTSDTVRGWETGRSTPRGRKAETYARLLNSLDVEPVVEPVGPVVEPGVTSSQAEQDVQDMQDVQDEQDAAGAREGETADTASGTAGGEAEASRTDETADTSSAADTEPAAQPGGSAVTASAASEGSRTATVERKRAGGGRGRFPFTRRRRGPAAPDRSRGPVPERPHAPLHDRTHPSGHPPGADHAPAPVPARDRDRERHAGPDRKHPVGRGRGHGHGPGQHRSPASVAVRDRPPLLERGPAHTGSAGPRRPDGAADALTPAESFDALYAFCAPALVRQTYLLTGRRDLARESVERAFQNAWQRWPEVARDPDPAGWVRAAAYEWALSPWHRLRPRHRHPEPPPSDALDRALMSTLLELPPPYRRALVLYDGVGLELPETAAETEASTRATVNRLAHAREAVAERLPDLADPEVLHWRLVELASAERLRAAKPPVVRRGGERRARFWTRAAIAFTVALIGTTALTLHTAPTRYEPPVPPGETVQGVPPPVAPGPLSESERKLRSKLREQQQRGPERLLPQPR